MFWILEEQDNTKLSSNFESAISQITRIWRSFENSRILQCLYELIKHSATEPRVAASFENLVYNLKFYKANKQQY